MKMKQIIENTFFDPDMLILAALYKRDCSSSEILNILNCQAKNVFLLEESDLCLMLDTLMDHETISPVPSDNQLFYHLEQSGKSYLKELIDLYHARCTAVNKYLNIQ